MSFRHTTQFTVEFGDCDPAQVVWFPNYFRWMDETRQKLSQVRPTSLGQAARISGVTPVDIAIMSIWLAKNSLYRSSML